MKALSLAVLLICPSIGMAGVLRAADVLDYRQLKSAGLADAQRDQYCCTSSTGQGFASTDRVGFRPQDGHFVRVTVDAQALASGTLAMSCAPRGLFDRSTQCETAELDAKVQRLLDAKVYGDLYGKYRNSWLMFEPDGKPVPITDKFGGHNVYRFERKDGVDTLVLGPVLKRPARLQLKFYGSRPLEEIPVVPGR
ncbi:MULTISPECIES: hypothetical protein [Cupriavidus]